MKARSKPWTRPQLPWAFCPVSYCSWSFLRSSDNSVSAFSLRASCSVMSFFKSPKSTGKDGEKERPCQEVDPGTPISVIHIPCKIGPNRRKNLAPSSQWASSWTPQASFSCPVPHHQSCSYWDGHWWLQALSTICWPLETYPPILFPKPPLSRSTAHALSWSQRSWFLGPQVGPKVSCRDDGDSQGKFLQTQPLANPCARAQRFPPSQSQPSRPPCPTAPRPVPQSAP